MINSKKMDLKKVGDLLNLSWNNKKLSNDVTNQDIEKYLKIIIENGAYGAKVLGAGGGGFIFVLAKKKKSSKNYR